MFHLRKVSAVAVVLLLVTACGGATEDDALSRCSVSANLAGGVNVHVRDSRTSCGVAAVSTVSERRVFFVLDLAAEAGSEVRVEVEVGPIDEGAIGTSPTRLVIIDLAKEVTWANDTCSAEALRHEHEAGTQEPRNYTFGVILSCAEPAISTTAATTVTLDEPLDAQTVVAWED
jgi:hypothetical protein